jgi:hypothetical protein
MFGLGAIPIRLDVGLHVLCGHEPDVMVLFPQGTSEVLRVSASFRSNQNLLPIRSKDEKLLKRKLLPQHDLASCVQPNNVKGRI